ncbi:unnamed protein product [Sphagnum troendelagicum]|uniref:Uncharacterized protein n=1 Tax=Sphagnum troendelagicum TaxID=128251 RepID=A0ABP0UFW8_9BRYO
MACEREEAKAMVVDYLKGRGVSAPIAARVVNKASRFVAHLLALLRSRYRTRYISGRELTTSEIRSTLLPYLESLGAKHKEGLADVFVSFPDPPPPRTELVGLLQVDGDVTTALAIPEISFSEYPQLQVHAVDGKLRPSLMYFLHLGFPPEQVEGLVSRFPTITSYSVNGKLKPVVDLLLGMGVSVSDLPTIVLKRPQIFGCSPEENLKPTAAFLEGLGVERGKWGKILVSFPHILTYSHSKLQHVVEFLLEIGLSSVDAGKVITRFPQITGYSVDAKLKPMMDYFVGIGVIDFGILIFRSPQTLGLSLELNIKPTITFFSKLGFSTEEITTIVSRFPQLLGLNVEKNIHPKWDYFLRLDRLRSELVDFPQYFGYSLEKRIKPRCEILLSSGLLWTLNRTLSTTETAFRKMLEKDSKHVALISEKVPKF